MRPVMTPGLRPALYRIAMRVPRSATPTRSAAVRADPPREPRRAAVSGHASGIRTR